MEVKASATYLRISPRKLRLLCDGMVGLKPDQALSKLNFYDKEGVKYIEKVLKQAVANGVNNFRLNKEDLKIKTIEIGEGPRIKRMDKSHGARFDRGIIKKRTAHLYLALETKEPEIKKTEIMKVNKKIEEMPKTEKGTHPPSSRLRRASGTKN